MNKNLDRFIELVNDESVDVNAKDPNDGMNALLKLSRNYGYENLIKLVQPLIERGIDVSATDPNGWNALHNLCRFYGHENELIDLIKLLKENNIDMEVTTNEGYHAYYFYAFLNPVLFTSEEIPKIFHKGNDHSEVAVVKYYQSSYVLKSVIFL